MTPETYMKRFHGSCGCNRCGAAEADSCPLEDEVPFSSCPVGEETALDPEDGCCCKASMVEALRLLCGERQSNMVDFDAFFFLTDSLAVGSPLSVHGDCTDNIVSPCASLERFSPCNCDLLDVSGTAYFAVTGLECAALEDVYRLTLCSLKAVAFQIKESDCECDCDTNFRRVTRGLRRAIRNEGGNTGSCGACEAHCDCDDCCCAAGVIQELSTRNLSRTATLTAGPLVLRNVTVLGSVGSVLVLASEELSRVYLVCANAVEAIG